ncbi:glycosyltransferase family 4 protein [Arthrobacter globiformis]|uniref:glycosyltransferase family 4 protein n=1 Tax=Arthrobacter globiformis TaxID=1665 RepID=UPI00155413E8|nr:glycosyltransferase family 4 protein [Arthrobacter globiformis]
MRIALIHSFYSSQAPSGENNIVNAHIAALEKKGHEVLLVAKYTDDEAEAPLYKLRTALNVATQRGPSPLEALKKFAPDIVHVHNLFPNFSKTWLDVWDGPLVATLHNFRPVCAAGTLFRDGHACTECIDFGSHRAVVNRCYRGSAVASLPLAIQTKGGIANDPVIRRADRIVVLSERAYGMYVSLGVDPAKVSLVPNFVDEAPFAPEAEPGRHWVYIGRLSSEKGVLTLIRSWPASEELRIYGEGPLLEEAKELVVNSPNISVLGGVASNEVPAHLSEARGLVFPSECPEGAPLVYLEALAAGRPIIARNGNSVADDVAAHGTGLVYSNSDQLGSSLDSVNENWAGYHAKTINRYMSAFSHSAWTQQIEGVYAEVIGRTGKK